MSEHDQRDRQWEETAEWIKLIAERDRYKHEMAAMDQLRQRDNEALIAERDDWQEYARTAKIEIAVLETERDRYRAALDAIVRIDPLGPNGAMFEPREIANRALALEGKGDGLP